MAEKATRILAVDDDTNLLRIYQDLFLSRGSENIAVATNLTSALRALETNPIQAVLLDLDLGGANGQDLLPHIQHRWPHVRTFVISAHSSPEISEGLKAQGAERIFKKPTSVEYIFGELCNAGILTDPVHAIRPGDAGTLSASVRESEAAGASRSASAQAATGDGGAHADLPPADASAPEGAADPREDWNRDEAPAEGAGRDTPLPVGGGASMDLKASGSGLALAMIVFALLLVAVAVGFLVSLK